MNDLSDNNVSLRSIKYALKNGYRVLWSGVGGMSGNVVQGVNGLFIVSINTSGDAVSMPLVWSDGETLCFDGGQFTIAPHY